MRKGTLTYSEILCSLCGSQILDQNERVRKRALLLSVISQLISHAYTYANNSGKKS